MFALLENMWPLSAEALKDPLQVDLHAALALNGATRAVKEILLRRKAMDFVGLAHEPLIVVAGEDHSTPAHLVQHMLVVDALKEKFPARDALCIAYELPHNVPVHTLGLEGLLEILPEGRESIAMADRNGVLSVQAIVANKSFTEALHARHAQLLHQLESGLPCRFTDAGLNDRALDWHDPTTAALLHARESTLWPSPVDAVSREGMAVRNDHMADFGIAFAAARGARILYQQTGNAHVAGSRSLGFPAAESLTAAFLAQGAHVLGLAHRQTVLPADVDCVAEDLVILPPAPTVTAERSERKAHVVFGQNGGIKIAFSRKPNGTDLQDAESEALYTNGLLAASGLKEMCLTRQELRRFKEGCASGVAQAVINTAFGR